MNLFRRKTTYGIVVFVKPDGDQFHAFCPAFEGLHVGGDTEEEAINNAKDAVVGYLKSLKKHGDPIPLGVMVKEEEELPQSPRSVTYYQQQITV